MYLVLLLITFLVSLAQSKVFTDGDTSSIYSSIFQMQSLLQAEIEFLKYLRENHNTIEEEVGSSTFLKEFMREYYDDGVFNPPKNRDDLETYVSNPLNAFGVISRTSQLKAHLGGDKIPEKFHNLTAIFPPQKDFIDSCSSIALIQESHDLVTRDLVQGKIVLPSVSFPW